MVRGPHECFELTGRQIADDVSCLYKTGFEICCARVDEDKTVDTLLILEGLQEHLFQRDGCSGQIAGMRVPSGQTVCSVSEESMTSIEEDEPIPGSKLANQVREIVLEHRLRSFEIEPNGDVLGGHAQLLNEEVLYRSRIGLSELDRANSLLLVGFNSDQNGVCRAH